MLLEEGKATYHYGLFQDNQTSLQTAQQFSTDLLMVRLPPPPCRVLEVGVGLGTTLSLLNQRGYDVHGITPDAQQIAYIQKNLDSGASVSCHSLQDFKAQPECFDVVLLQESAQYIEPLVIFNKALDLLPLSGDLVIIDEFALKYDEAGIGGLHLLNDMVALAERFGFELVERMDLSTQAAPTLDYLLHYRNAPAKTDQGSYFDR
ncbi:MAG: methyltransferase domain-containing protein [Nitrosomonas sp.]|nr:methyltransferase domain-containing protein [Nitrosomonas sp.]